MKEIKRFILFFISELKPKGRLLTPFNIITTPIILLGIALIIYRFTNGLGAISEGGSQDFPWGLLIGFNVVTGVALAGGGYIIPFIVYVLGLKKYRPMVRSAILTALLGYIFYAFAVLLDLGRPWHIFNPIIGNSFGISSILFIFVWVLVLYITCLFAEFLPAITEWLGNERFRKFAKKLVVGAVIFAITLSTISQAGVGALFLLAPTKLHPLWYSNITIFFFISSIFSGLSVVIIIDSISHKVFKDQAYNFGELIIGLGKAACLTMFVYLSLKLIDIAHSRHWQYFQSPMGHLYLVELIGFILFPMVMFTEGVRRKVMGLIKLAAFITVIGVILNRLNVTMIAFKWYLPHHFPGWMECVISLTIILIQIWAFRWIVNRMPILREHKWENE
ncbi:MAG: hypothetical protein AB1397_05530 [bacterium]